MIFSWTFCIFDKNQEKDPVGNRPGPVLPMKVCLILESTSYNAEPGDHYIIRSIFGADGLKPKAICKNWKRLIFPSSLFWSENSGKETVFVFFILFALRLCTWWFSLFYPARRCNSRQKDSPTSFGRFSRWFSRRRRTSKGKVDTVSSRIKVKAWQWCV